MLVTTEVHSSGGEGVGEYQRVDELAGTVVSFTVPVLDSSASKAGVDELNMCQVS